MTGTCKSSKSYLQISKLTYEIISNKSITSLYKINCSFVSAEMYFSSNFSQLKLKCKRCLKIQILEALRQEAFSNKTLQATPGPFALTWNSV